MGQVPHPLIVGNGKMATHFGHYLSLLGINHSQWSRRTHSDVDLGTLFNNSTLTVLLLSDSAIESFVTLHEFLKQKPLVHFSGALSIPNIIGAHPLMAFSQNLYNLDFYKQIPFILETDQENHLKFLPNEFFTIPCELKSYYHMLCVLSGNFTCILWQKFFDEFQTKFNLPKQAGELYLRQITQNIIRDHNTALTGPLVRNDSHTIRKHLDALKTDEFKDIYNAFVTLFENRRNNTHEYS